MKNVFCTLAFTLIGSFAFASNSIVDSKLIVDENVILKETDPNLKPVDNCFYTITTYYYNSDGSYSHSTRRNYSTYAVSQTDCNSSAQNHVTFLNSLP